MWMATPQTGFGKGILVKDSIKEFKVIIHLNISSLYSLIYLILIWLLFSENLPWSKVFFQKNTKSFELKREPSVS